MRLINADALLEAVKEKRKFENIPQYLQDEYKDIPEVLLRTTLRVDEIKDIITNAPTVQREGWVSVPIEPTYQMCAKALVACPVFGLHINAIPNMYQAMISSLPNTESMK